MPAWSKEHPQPPWSKAHEVKLAPSHVYDGVRKDDKGTDTVARHAPLRLVEQHGEVGRRAGTYGVHIEDDETGVEFLGEVDGDWDASLAGDRKVITVRDVKKASKNYKVAHPRAHAFARYVLPVTESEIKEQDWPGKKKEDEKPPSPSGSASSISSGTMSSESGSGSGSSSDHSSGKEDKNRKNGAKDDKDESKNVDESGDGEDKPKEPELTDEQQRFLERLIEEMRTIDSFKNNPGQPKGELKLLDGDALEQLESRLSIDDQYVCVSYTRPVDLMVPLLLYSSVIDMWCARLHYVRSHGAVPQLSWETHELDVYADPPELMLKPRKWTMDELADGDFRVIEIPVTFGCDGNRRKEMNMMKRTTGFNFTTAGVSTCLWRGVLVRDVLLASGLQDQPEHERWYLNFEGADEPSEGPYATSIPLLHAMNPAHDVILVFGQNGRVLHPDHGYPLRTIIPGFVGGRQVKWLKKMWVTKESNRSYYHIWDNRVVPTFIDSKEHPLATAFFHHEDTACYEQCLQSAIFKPAHDERIPLSDKDALLGTYTVEGYAFSSGDRIERVELSLDGGKTWKWCFKHFLEEPLRHGEKFWAWIFWSCELKLQEMVNAQEIIVRAQDSRKNYQPAEISWYDDAWIILDNKVYDVTSVLSWHPGGANAILAYAGKATVDVTNEYKGIHDSYANSKKDECLIGALSEEGIKAMEEDARRAAKELAKVKEERKGLALQPDVFTRAKLVERKEVSSDTRLYVFELPRKEDGSPGVLGLPVGQHVQIAVHFKDQAVMRSYTPVHPVLPHEEDGTIHLLVKTYMPSEGGSFPPGGTVSNYLDCMEDDEEIDIRGPTGGIKYLGHGKFDIDGEEYRFDKINLVGGGSGLTPHWQLIHAIMFDDSDKTVVSFIDSNRTYDDILMRDELQKYADGKPEKFKLWHVLSSPPKDKEWKYSEGRLDRKMMEEHFYAAGEGVATFLCGPPAMIEKAALPGLKEMGFEDGKTVFGY
ncbi:uncharacterized protein B0H18DRAFT_1190512 [Fomitopsis serialis]|uniref:uncharacterized protein n=1 Tax=Fomitopsis serialis TaxID=139415 RepID=UPI00200869F0|nr:uncharacterized protein B0H18DRAFT_1190512 [Neoantrodia serialis]KAH9920934.1 hypothetical protein B0H18DRAFT_1190512 [Neoantrodia serialis]